MLRVNVHYCDGATWTRIMAKSRHLLMSRKGVWFDVTF